MTLKGGPTDGLLCATHEAATLVSSEIKSQKKEIKSQHLEMFGAVSQMYLMSAESNKKFWLVF